MKAGGHARQILKLSEGLRLTAYPDPGSRDGTPWTIGYGHTKGVRKGQTITKRQAEEFLTQDLKVYEDAVNRLVKVPLTQNQFDALLSFVYNIGIGAFTHSTLLRVLNRGEYALASKQFPRWNKNDGKEMVGLTNRRAEEKALFDSTSELAKPVATTSRVSPNPWATLFSKLLNFLRSLF